MTTKSFRVTVDLHLQSTAPRARSRDAPLLGGMVAGGSSAVMEAFVPGADGFGSAQQWWRQRSKGARSF